MTNKEIIRKLKLTASLMELHGANQFKVRAYNSTIFTLERLDVQLEGKDEKEMIQLGITKGMAAKIAEIFAEETFSELEELLQQTPEGILDMLEIKGIGAKKISTIWKELGIESIKELLVACKEGKIAELKGFGAKTQQLIIEQIEYIRSNQGKLLFSQAEPFAVQLKEHLEKNVSGSLVEIAGQIRRNFEIIDKLQLVVGADDFSQLRNVLNDVSDITYKENISGPFVWRGEIEENQLEVEIQLSSKEKFYNQLFIYSAAERHLAHTVNQQPLRKIAQSNNFESEEAIYQTANLPFIAPELREGVFELDLAKENKLPTLVEVSDLKGVLHNHSTYSDGKHTLREMAEKCIELGYEYLGISDHSKTAFYANGLTEERVAEQHAEIEQLNQELAPFKIFKGIESDILNDGSLDYAPEILESFDFIVASIHSNLKMDESKATARLVKAIENPYTTILGHPTGRLLLKREGYPIDHKTVIDACAKHQVSIEINANPLRLDLDWRWVNYALSKGVKIAINPDAHDKERLTDMRFGLLVGRKAGLTKEMTLNAMNLEEISLWFDQRKEMIKA